MKDRGFGGLLTTTTAPPANTSDDGHLPVSPRDDRGLAAILRSDRLSTGSGARQTLQQLVGFPPFWSCWRMAAGLIPWDWSCCIMAAGISKVCAAPPCRPP